MGHEGSQKNLNATLVRSLVIGIPNRDEQARIAEILGVLDTDIQQERAVLETLRSLKQALMSVLLTGEVRVTPDEGAP